MWGAGACYLTHKGGTTVTEIRRLNWGCGDVTPPGWINSDIKSGPGIDISADILEGLPLDDDSIDYISSQHALPALKVWNQLDALSELRRVLKPGGVHRVGHHHTVSSYPEIVELDRRESGRSFYVEAFK
jgi:predicted SAM-dependent methyltransferase